MAPDATGPDCMDYSESSELLFFGTSCFTTTTCGFWPLSHAFVFDSILKPHETSTQILSP